MTADNRNAVAGPGPQEDQLPGEDQFDRHQWSAEGYAGSNSHRIKTTECTIPAREIGIMVFLRDPRQTARPNASTCIGMSVDWLQDNDCGE